MAAGKTSKSILVSTAVRLAPFNLPQIDPELDLDGRGRQELFDRDGGFADGGELVTVASGDEAGEEERAALLAYNRYLHRYDKEWLEKHPRQEPQSPAR